MRSHSARALAILGVAAVTACAPVPERAGFAALDGWQAEDHAAALAEFRRLCTQARFRETPPPHWAALCVAAHEASDPRAFFETMFQPQVSGGEALVTGYYEPVIDGARAPGGRYSVPLYALPPGPEAALPRAEIEAGALAGMGLEIAWLADPVEAFFLQIQGSGRLRLPDGTTMRVGYAGKNGQPYVAIGRLLAERGEIPLEQVTAQSIRDWLRADPARGTALMYENPSFVYFRELTGLPPEAGPIGTLGIPLTGGRSAAIDPAFHPLGLPVWIEADAPSGPIRRLWFAADTGGAIKGRDRADLFTGTGEAAGAEAGALRARGRVVALVPRGPA